MDLPPQVQVWLELDNLVNPDGPRGPGGAQGFFTEGDMLRALLALLPPPPASGGWPDASSVVSTPTAQMSAASVRVPANASGDM